MPLGSFAVDLQDQRDANRAFHKTQKQVLPKSVELKSVNGQTVAHLALRFQKSDGSGGGSASQFSSTMIKRADDKKRFEKAWALQNMEHRDNKVNLYRAYREGELPDVEIEHADLLRPLMALHTDPVMAKLLLVSVVAGLVNKAADYGAADRISDLVASLQRMFEATSCSSATFLCTLLEISQSINHPSITSTFSANTIAFASMRTKTEASGALLLEKIIAHRQQIPAVVVQPPAKQRRQVHAAPRLDPTVEDYQALAKLYQQMDEQDIVASIHSVASSQKITREALLMKNQNDFQTALDLYLGAIQKWEENGDEGWDNDEKPNQYEVSLWEDERLECLKALGSWDILAQNVLVQVDDDPLQLWSLSSSLREAYIGYFLNAGLHSPATSCGSVLAFLDASLQDSTHTQELNHKFQMVTLFSSFCATTTTTTTTTTNTTTTTSNHIAVTQFWLSFLLFLPLFSTGNCFIIGHER